MKTTGISSGYAHTKYYVDLGPEDQGRTDAEMITAADSHGKYGRQPRHLGGEVERRGDNKAVITVYID